MPAFKGLIFMQLTIEVGVRQAAFEEDAKDRPQDPGVSFRTGQIGQQLGVQPSCLPKSFTQTLQF